MHSDGFIGIERHPALELPSSAKVYNIRVPTTELMCVRYERSTTLQLNQGFVMPEWACAKCHPGVLRQSVRCWLCSRRMSAQTGSMLAA